MLPSVHTVGYVSRAAIYKKINEKGGFIDFQIACELDDPKVGDINPVRYFKVEHWVKEGNTISANLTEGKPVYVEGKWNIDRVGEKEFHKIKASKVQVITTKEG